MQMTPGARKFALTAHVTTSVGWLGAVIAFLVLSVIGVVSTDSELVRSAYLSMNLVGQFVIVPLSLGSLTTGVIQSLGTHWGLFRYYWVSTKLVLTVGATALLLLHQFTAVAAAARRVAESAAGAPIDVGRLGPQLVGDAALAVLTLLVTTTLSIYKPWGLTPAGRNESESGREQVSRNTASKVLIAITCAIVGAIVIIHLAGGGLHHGR
jgi:hypothetical protein